MGNLRTGFGPLLVTHPKYSEERRSVRDVIKAMIKKLNKDVVEIRKEEEKARGPEKQSDPNQLTGGLKAKLPTSGKWADRRYAVTNGSKGKPTRADEFGQLFGKYTHNDRHGSAADRSTAQEQERTTVTVSRAPKAEANTTYTCTGQTNKKQKYEAENGFSLVGHKKGRSNYIWEIKDDSGNPLYKLNKPYYGDKSGRPTDDDTWDIAETESDETEITVTFHD